MFAEPLPKLLSSEVQHHIEDARMKGKRIVFVSGVFDLLHQEHVHFLEKAKEVGDFLVVALESDIRVRQLKGEGRPINPQEVRKSNLEKLSIADIVFVLPEQFSQPSQHRQLIEEVRPDFLAVSSHTAHLEKKKMIVEEFGGKLAIVHQHNPEVSTTQLLAQTSKR